MQANEPVRWAILGSAGIATKLLAGARRSSAVTIVAVGSRSQARADAFAASNGIERAYGTYEALLADREVEAVYIALPNSLHHPWTLRALAAGKHVLCEKPYSRHPAEVDEAFDLADRAGLVLSEAFMWRHHPQARLAVELLPGLGSLQTIRATFSFVLDDPADIRLGADLAGGSLMDVGCYCVSGARLLAGEEPDLAFGLATNGPSGVDLRFSGLLHFPSGTVAELSAGFTSRISAGSRRSARPDRSGSATRGSPNRRRSSALGSRRSSSRRIRTSWRSRTSAPRSGVARSRGWDARTHWARLGRSMRCTARPSSGRRSGSSDRPRRSGGSGDRPDKPVARVSAGFAQWLGLGTGSLLQVPAFPPVRVGGQGAGART